MIKLAMLVLVAGISTPFSSLTGSSTARAVMLCRLTSFKVLLPLIFPMRRLKSRGAIVFHDRSKVYKANCWLIALPSTLAPSDSILKFWSLRVLSLVERVIDSKSYSDLGTSILTEERLSVVSLSLTKSLSICTDSLLLTWLNAISRLVMCLFC